ncbi:MAG: DUF924 family protein [Halioglobus sp.]
MATPIDEIHAFWFGPLTAEGLSAPSQHSLWFTKQEDTDQKIAELFQPLVEQALAGQLDEWVESPEGLVALVLLLDQFTRNIFRGSATAFAGDTQALALAQSALSRQQHLSLPPIHQVFLLMPLEHTEELAVQEQCIEEFRALHERSGLPQIADFSRYAVAHRDVIAQFGRFPHRNLILKRQSTHDELTYLQTHGGF